MSLGFMPECSGKPAELASTWAAARASDVVVDGLCGRMPRAFAHFPYRRATLVGRMMARERDSNEVSFMRGWTGSLLLSTLALITGGCMSTRQPLQTVPHVDIPRYMGDWYVIANIPYFAEKDCVDSIESYAQRADGNIDNWFSCRKKSFDAPMKRKASALAIIKDKDSNATWQVRFFKVISIQYLILDLDPNYQWVAVGHPSRRYGWIMARQKTLADSTYNEILGRLGKQGYDTSRFAKVPQQVAGVSNQSQ
jgi:apolipoprotein D and lipocalin family protein